MIKISCKGDVSSWRKVERFKILLKLGLIL
jgi:hypothetical protein